jgi:hypothetical protein
MPQGSPPAIQVCTYPDHPATRHGHYGRHWCSDFRSPLLSRDNGGRVERGWIIIFEKAT